METGPAAPLHRYIPRLTSVRLPSGASSHRRELTSTSVPMMPACSVSAGSPSNVKPEQTGNVREVIAPLVGGAPGTLMHQPLAPLPMSNASGSLAVPAAESVGADAVTWPGSLEPKVTRPGAIRDSASLTKTDPADPSQVTTCSWNTAGGSPPAPGLA